MQTHLLYLMEFMHFGSSDPLSFFWMLNINPYNFYNFHRYRVQFFGSSFPKRVVLRGREGDMTVRISQRDVHGEAMLDTGTPGRNCSLWRAHGTDLPQRIATCGTTATRTGEEHQEEGVAEGSFYELTTDPLSLPIHPALFRVGQRKRNQEWKSEVEPGSGSGARVMFCFSLSRPILICNKLISPKSSLFHFWQ